MLLFVTQSWDSYYDMDSSNLLLNSNIWMKEWLNIDWRDLVTGVADGLVDNVEYSNTKIKCKLSIFIFILEKEEWSEL